MYVMLVRMKKRLKATFALIPVTLLALAGCANGEITNSDIAEALDSSLTPTAAEQVGKQEIKEADYCTNLLKDYRSYSQISAQQQQVIADKSNKDQALELIGAQQKTISDIDKHTSPYRVTDNDDLNAANEELAPMNEKLLNAYVTASNEEDPSQIDPTTKEWGEKILPIAQYCYGQEE